MSENGRILLQLKTRLGQAIYLRLLNEDGTTSTLVGIIQGFEDNDRIVNVSSRGKPYPVFVADIRHARPAYGDVQP